MQADPRVSIITVVYNGEKTISRTMESILKQTYKNIEYIIVDGLSTDNTLAVAKKHLAGNPAGKIISEADKGLFDAMNKGIAAASGELIGILNSDDWYELDAVETMVKEYLKFGEGAYYGIERRLINDLEYLIERSHHQYLNIRMIPHPTTFVTKSVYNKFGGFDLKYPYSADVDLMLRFQKSNVSFHPVDQVIANFSLGGASSSINGKMDNLRCRRDHGYISQKDFLLRYSKLKVKDIFKGWI